MMECFRPGAGLLPSEFLIIKQSAPLPAFGAVLLLGLFGVSFFRTEVHSLMAIKAVALALILFLLACTLMLLFAIKMISWSI